IEQRVHRTAPRLRARTRLRRATSDDAGVAWTVRTDAIRISCATHYPASSIEPWAAEAPPANFAALLAGNGGPVAEVNGVVAGFGVVHPQSGEIAALFV